MAFKTLKQKKFGFANKGKGLKMPKIKTAKVKTPKVSMASMAPDLSIKPKQPMKVDKITTPVGMGARSKWVDGVM